jgi:hypothetical protein
MSVHGRQRAADSPRVWRLTVGGQCPFGKSLGRNPSPWLRFMKSATPTWNRRQTIPTSAFSRLSLAKTSALLFGGPRDCLASRPGDDSDQTPIALRDVPGSPSRRASVRKLASQVPPRYARRPAQTPGCSYLAWKASSRSSSSRTDAKSFGTTSRAARSWRASVMRNGLHLGTRCGQREKEQTITGRIVQDKHVMLIVKFNAERSPHA